MAAGRRSNSTPDSRCVPLLCDHDYRAVRTVEATLQTATAVVSGHARWSAVGTARLYAAILGWIRVAVLVLALHIDTYCVILLVFAISLSRRS